jgi:hypothetical protein
MVRACLFASSNEAGLRDVSGFLNCLRFEVRVLSGAYEIPLTKLAVLDA